jgi:hypothetical protein
MAEDRGVSVANRACSKGDSRPPSAASQSRSFGQRRPVGLAVTAIAFFWPTITTSCLPRVTRGMWRGEFDMPRDGERAHPRR